jgi:hypothetical protein
MVEFTVPRSHRPSHLENISSQGMLQKKFLPAYFTIHLKV